MAKKGNMLGAWAFLIGVLLALIIGLASLNSNATWVLILIVLGLIVGFLNVTATESKEFLLAATALVIVSALGGQTLLTLQISVVNIGGVLQALVTLFVPATIIVALKDVFAIAKS